MNNKSWVGSAVSMDDLRATAERAGLRVDRVTGEGTQYTVVKLIRD